MNDEAKLRESAALAITDRSSVALAAAAWAASARAVASTRACSPMAASTPSSSADSGALAHRSGACSVSAGRGPRFGLSGIGWSMIMSSDSVRMRSSIGLSAVSRYCRVSPPRSRAPTPPIRVAMPSQPNSE
eukprot:46935-Prymnesium_polylepis.1